ncbi:hydantoinase/oxoprolinase family protein [Ancylobacter polymorphus]|uniref:N-methylhydantoinase A n=1 Tax=Ancylobacter polymorphus TaxID=223390 RepID=A0ABU0BGJ0_9HYPH|nr:hydantoinase/oxoprolinase family protein [Ancylobacter polymorphus]MDQ0304951.1 N-methylhydantoinase A [Ancylobacter polymorphus]
MSMRIGIDVGGTFTDVTGFDDQLAEVVLIRKYSSNPAEPMRVMQQIATDLAGEFGPEAVSLILHGSTAALNTLLEDKGVKVGLLTTAGFRDVYEIGRQWRGEEVFNIFAPPPKMLLERRAVQEVRGRLDWSGAEVEPLNREDIERGVRVLLEQGVEAIAVAFLFSYANPAHEREAGEIIKAMAPGLFVALSSDVNPEWREYERTASTVANCYIGPPVSHYLHNLEELLVETFPNCRPLMMKSDGGAGSATMLANKPIQTVMSGPVAGVIGSRYLGDLKGIENLITFDTGGTSSDMAVIPNRPLFKSEVAVGRHPLRTQTVDIDTIGAGGGSIASVELSGVLRVGPRSAGAWPGPACYDRGGTEPTLTDALVVLGHLSPSALLQGDMRLASDKAWQAVRDKLATPLAMSETEAAWGVLTVLANNCVTAMRTITVERGYDPREFVLVPFGGMGPTIASKIAADLGVERLLVPRDPGTFSAWGMLVTDVHQEMSQTRLVPLDGAEPAEVEALFAAMEERILADLERESFPRERLHTLRSAGMRYRGQSYEVAVPLGPITGRADLDQLAARFHEAHYRRYGHMAQNETIDIVSFKVTGVGEINKPVLTPVARRDDAVAEPVGHRSAYFGAEHGRLEAAVYRRSSLVPGAKVTGPAIFEERTSTVVLYPGQVATVDEYLNLEIER